MARILPFKEQVALKNPRQEPPKISEETMPIFLKNRPGSGKCSVEDPKCFNACEPGRRVCLDHIPYTLDARYGRCQFISERTNIKCTKVFRKDECRNKKEFCRFHVAMVSRIRRKNAFKNRYKDTADSIVQNLKHYTKFGIDDSRLPRPDELRTPKAQKRARELDFMSESSDSDDDDAVICGRLHRKAHESVEAATMIDTFDQDEEPEHIFDFPSNIYETARTHTVPELIKINLDKMLNLKQAYLEYFDIIRARYKIAQSYYIPKIKKEVEKYGHYRLSEAKTNKSRKLIRQLRTMKRYKRPHRVEALLKKEALTKKLELTLEQIGQFGDENLTRIAMKQKNELKKAKQMDEDPDTSPCQFLIKSDKGDGHCCRTSIPLAKYCSQHIHLVPKSQLIFTKCAHGSCLRLVHPRGRNKYWGLYCMLHRPINVTSFDLSEEKAEVQPTSAASSQTPSTSTGDADISSNQHSSSRTMASPSDDSFVFAPSVAQTDAEAALTLAGLAGICPANPQNLASAETATTSISNQYDQNLAGMPSLDINEETAERPENIFEKFEKS